MYKKILIPIDLGSTEKAARCIETAKLFAAPDAEIRLISIVDELPGFVLAELPSGTLENTRKLVTEQLTDFAKKAGASVTTEIRTGSIYRTILEAAEEWNADIIIVGSHKPGAQDYLLGSTAARVVRHANIPVLVMR